MRFRLARRYAHGRQVDVPSEPARRQSIEKKPVPIAATFNPGVADLDPRSFVASLASEWARRIWVFAS
jgi:hypothetical protein